MIMRRVLQGRLFYLVFATLTLLLYARSMPDRDVEPFGSTLHPGSAPPIEESLQEPRTLAELSGGRSDSALSWWPAGVDPASVRQMVLEHPEFGLAISFMSLFIFGMMIGGLALTVWAVLSGRIRSVWKVASQPLPPWSFGELVRITLLTVMTISLLPFVRVTILSRHLWWVLDRHLWMTASMVFLDLLIILLVLAFATGKASSLAGLFRLSGRTASRAIGVGLRGYVAAFPWILLLLFAVVELARRFGIKPPLEPIHELMFREQRPLVLVLTVLLACVIGPIAEELFFRGVLYPAVRQRTSRAIALVVSGAVFALVHTNLLGFLPIMILGCLLADLYDRTGSLASPIVVHILHNTFLISLALMFRPLVIAGTGP